MHNLRTIRAELEQLAELEHLTPAQQSRWDELVADAERAQQAEAELAERVANGTAASIPACQGMTTTRTSVSFTGDPFDLDGIDRTASTDDLAARALTGLERASHWLEDDHRARATEVLESASDDDRGDVARYLLLVGHPDYRTAFARTAAGEQDLMSPAERSAARAVSDFASRAIGISNVTGKLVPAHLDPAVMLTNDGSVNPIRQHARVETISTAKWTGVTSEGIDARWSGADVVEVGDDAPTFANPEIPVHQADAFCPISFSAYADWITGDAELARMFADARDRLEETALAVGTGSDQPTGLVTALVTATNSHFVMATNSAFTVTDLLTGRRTLPRRFRDAARWLMHPAYHDRVRVFGTNDSAFAYTVDLTADGIPRLLGRPLHESDAMTGTLSTTTNNAMVYGDFRQYVIADRLGLTIEFVPHTFGTNGRPNTQRGWLAHWRTGADLVVPQGMRLFVNPAA